MLFVRDLWYVCACVYESSEASAYSFGLATNPNPTRARRYPLNINPKPDPKPDSISGPAGSGRVADLYYTCKIRDGTELEMETQSDTRHNLKTTPTPTPTVSLHCEKLPPPCHLFITKKKKKCLKADVTMCIANKLKKQ